MGRPSVSALAGHQRNEARPVDGHPSASRRPARRSSARCPAPVQRPDPPAGVGVPRPADPQRQVHAIPRRPAAFDGLRCEPSEDPLSERKTITVLSSSPCAAEGLDEAPDRVVDRLQRAPLADRGLPLGAAVELRPVLPPPRCSGRHPIEVRRQLHPRPGEGAAVARRRGPRRVRRVGREPGEERLLRGADEARGVPGQDVRRVVGGRTTVVHHRPVDRDVVAEVVAVPAGDEGHPSVPARRDVPGVLLFVVVEVLAEQPGPVPAACSAVATVVASSKRDAARLVSTPVLWENSPVRSVARLGQQSGLLS